ncbi:MAG TPA: hypothetical protein VFP19_02800, partial [Candidatus Limnocylindrales bacterium]|nr:hypothetical protein [Candidatus Limnocylindrales bacterium]
QIKDHGVVDRAPTLEGKSMFVTVASTHKPKMIEAPGRPAGAVAPESAVPEAQPAVTVPAAPAPAVPAQER